MTYIFVIEDRYEPSVTFYNHIHKGDTLTYGGVLYQVTRIHHEIAQQSTLVWLKNAV